MYIIFIYYVEFCPVIYLINLIDNLCEKARNGVIDILNSEDLESMPLSSQK